MFFECMEERERERGCFRYEWVDSPSLLYKSWISCLRLMTLFTLSWQQNEVEEPPKRPKELVLVTSGRLGLLYGIVHIRICVVCCSLQEPLGAQPDFGVECCRADDGVGFIERIQQRLV